MTSWYEMEMLPWDPHLECVMRCCRRWPMQVLKFKTDDSTDLKNIDKLNAQIMTIICGEPTAAAVETESEIHTFLFALSVLAPYHRF